MVTRREWLELLAYAIIVWGAVYLLSEYTTAFDLVRP